MHPADSPCCTEETNATLQTNYTPVKQFKNRDKAGAYKNPVEWMLHCDTGQAHRLPTSQRPGPRVLLQMPHPATPPPLWFDVVPGNEGSRQTLWNTPVQLSQPAPSHWS